MPRLIVVNGPPGVGKSTLAHRYVEDHPFTLDLDLDGIRPLLGQWRDAPAAASLRARELGLAMARDHLVRGHDVVMPQYLARPAFHEQAQELAEQAGATFVEVVLMDDRDTVVERFRARTARPDAEAQHRLAADLVASLGGDEALFAMYDRLLLVIAARPLAHVLPCPAGSQDAVYGHVLDIVGDRGLPLREGFAP